MANKKEKKWNKLNPEQKLYAENLGTNADNITDRQYQILTKEKSDYWDFYQWHLGSTEWNQPIKKNKKEQDIN